MSKDDIAFFVVILLLVAFVLDFLVGLRVFETLFDIVIDTVESAARAIQSFVEELFGRL